MKFFKHAARTRLGLEELETRLALAPFHWSGLESPDFWDRDNWVEDAAPPNDGTADIYIGTLQQIAEYPKSTAQNVDLKSLHLYYDEIHFNTPFLTLDRSALTLRNGGTMTGGTLTPRIYQVDSTGGGDVRNITLAGGTFIWTHGEIIVGAQTPDFIVQEGASLHVNLGGGFLGRTVRLGDRLVNDGGTINIIGGPPAGSTFEFSNGYGLTNQRGTVTVSHDVSLTRDEGHAINLNNAVIVNYSGATVTMRDGTITSELPVNNSGTFQVLGEAQTAVVTIKNASPTGTSNLGFRQDAGLTRIEANGFNATLNVNEGYAVLQGALIGLASGTAFTPKLASANGDITFGNLGTGSVDVSVGDSTHVNTVFVLAPKTLVTIGTRTNVHWQYQKVGGTASHSKLEVQGAVTIAAANTHATISTVAGTPANGEQATVLTSTGVFTGTFATNAGIFTGGGWNGLADNPNKKYVFTATVGGGGGEE